MWLLWQMVPWPNRAYKGPTSQRAPRAREYCNTFHTTNEELFEFAYELSYASAVDTGLAVLVGGEPGFLLFVYTSLSSYCPDVLDGIGVL
ncbi:MAG: hypothetical protein HKN94_10980 [Acidimicrobiales bacterium]|nr:hypothetical protein [Acidimicrobiia bacterium]NNC80662.1 hypothetical protein [Acidimicrobiales bacterium]